MSEVHLHAWLFSNPCGKVLIIVKISWSPDLRVQCSAMICNCSRAVWKYIRYLDNCDISDNSYSSDSRQEKNMPARIYLFFIISNMHYLGFGRSWVCAMLAFVTYLIPLNIKAPVHSVESNLNNIQHTPLGPGVLCPGESNYPPCSSLIQWKWTNVDRSYWDTVFTLNCILYSKVDIIFSSAEGNPLDTETVLTQDFCPKQISLRYPCISLG